MYQIKVSGILLPTIYYSLKEAMAACRNEKARAGWAMTDIIRVG